MDLKRKKNLTGAQIDIAYVKLCRQICECMLFLSISVPKTVNLAEMFKENYFYELLMG